MSSRRQFMKTASAAGAGLAAASTMGVMQEASAHQMSVWGGEPYTGPREMVKNSKILSIMNSDGTETLGVVTLKGVIDVRAELKKSLVAHGSFGVSASRISNRC